MADPQKIIREIGDLPTLPSVVAKVNELVNSANTSAGDINAVISRDVSLSAKVLKLVNSSFYGFPRRITSITHAVVILGFNTVRNLVLSAFVFGAFKSKTRKFDLQAFWTHSIATAVAANATAQHLSLPQNQKEDAFMSGLLHDVGKVIMCAFMEEESERVLEAVRERDILFMEAERDALPRSMEHSALGSTLLEQWNLPVKIVQLVQKHHQPPAEGEDARMCALIHFADILARSLCIGNGGDNKIPRLEPAAWEQLGMKWEDTGRIMDQTLAEMQRTSAFFDLI